MTEEDFEDERRIGIKKFGLLFFRLHIYLDIEENRV